MISVLLLFDLNIAPPQLSVKKIRIRHYVNEHIIY